MIGINIKKINLFGVPKVFSPKKAEKCGGNERIQDSNPSGITYDAKVDVTREEMFMIVETLKNRKLIVYQTSHSDFRASIIKEGIEFVETTSFTDSELPIVIPD